MKSTNINEVRSTSIVLAYAVPLKFDQFGLMSHPFTNVAVSIVPGETTKEGTPKFLDLSKKADANTWLDHLRKQILKSDLKHIYFMVNTPYKLTWLKFCEDALSPQDFAEYFADAWVLSENPNGDVNVSISDLIKWYKKYSKEHLMVEEDQKVYESIPETITLYRGVGKNRNPYGLSYTASKEKADWFQNRFYKGEGFLITLNVKKEDVLVYFNTRNEDEYVVDTNKYKSEIKSQIIKEV